MELAKLTELTRIMQFPYDIVYKDELEIKWNWNYNPKYGFTFNDTLEKLLIKILNTKIAYNSSCCDPTQEDYITFKLFYKLDTDETKQYNREDKLILIGGEEIENDTPRIGYDGIIQTDGKKLHSLSNIGSVQLSQRMPN